MVGGTFLEVTLFCFFLVLLRMFQRSLGQVF
jgi:hypothetical protein